jgi:hypothetical protein
MSDFPRISKTIARKIHRAIIHKNTNLIRKHENEPWLKAVLHSQEEITKFSSGDYYDGSIRTS